MFEPIYPARTNEDIKIGAGMTTTFTALGCWFTFFVIHPAFNTDAIYPIWLFGTFFSFSRRAGMVILWSHTHPFTQDE